MVAGISTYAKILVLFGKVVEPKFGEIIEQRGSAQVCVIFHLRYKTLIVKALFAFEANSLSLTQ